MENYGIIRILNSGTDLQKKGVNYKSPANYRNRSPFNAIFGYINRRAEAETGGRRLLELSPLYSLTCKYIRGSLTCVGRTRATNLRYVKFSVEHSWAHVVGLRCGNRRATRARV